MRKKTISAFFLFMLCAQSGQMVCADDANSVIQGARCSVSDVKSSRPSVKLLYAYIRFTDALFGKYTHNRSPYWHREWYDSVPWHQIVPLLIVYGYLKSKDAFCTACTNAGLCVWHYSA